MGFKDPMVSFAKSSRAITSVLALLWTSFYAGVTLMEQQNNRELKESVRNKVGQEDNKKKRMEAPQQGWPIYHSHLNQRGS